MRRSSSPLQLKFKRFVCQTSPNPMGIEVDRAKGSFIFDTQGKPYLDFISGIGVTNLGHGHPRIIRAVMNQVRRYSHVMVYGECIQKPQILLAAELARITPRPLSVTYFTNSGTEAVEGALKTAKKATARKKLVAFQGSFHGDTHGSLSVTGREIYRKPFRPLLPNVTLLPFNEKKALYQIDRQTAAVIVEPIQGEGGVRIPDQGFLPALRQRCHQVGAILIFDEVMTGLGRTGKLFAFNHWNCVPDILVLAKSLGGGLPLGAFVGRRDLMETLSRNPPLSHVTTFGGNPVSCASGLAFLQILTRSRLDRKAKAMGKRIIKELLIWKKKIGGIQDVRGRGLLIGIELSSHELSHCFVERCFHLGLILGWTLHSNRLIRLAPPLTLSEREMKHAMGIMRTALDESLP